MASLEPLPLLPAQTHSRLGRSRSRCSTQNRLTLTRENSRYSSTANLLDCHLEDNETPYELNTWRSMIQMPITRKPVLQRSDTQRSRRTWIEPLDKILKEPDMWNNPFEGLCPQYATMQYPPAASLKLHPEFSLSHLSFVTSNMPQLSYTEENVIQAMLDVTDNGLSQNQAAQKNGVPQTTLSDRLRGLPSRSEITQPAQLLSKSQESRLVTWILRQEALGYAPSHSQVRATVAALLRQQGRERHIGVHWLARFIKRHPDIETKVGKRQEAARFNSFTPMAVNWYFGIRESEYGWIKPENTVNVDEGGIMAGFGLDSLVIGSSDPRRKAFLKGSQSRTWTTFIEAVTADGRLLKPGIIFKGKELQQQWFIDEFRKIADWYYITSDNGWTDNHIAVEWLKEIYLPQTQPADESDARLIILDGHGSHVSDEWMATCFLNNVYCCYLPAHCSHGLQPLDNGVFNASKAAYRKELQKLTSLTDSAPVDKVNFIKAYAKARAVGMTKKNILSGWRVTGNWPISRRKALMHPEIQPDKKETTPGSDGHRDGQVDSDHTPTTSRHIRDLGKNKSPSTRRRYSVISRGFEAQESKIASLGTRIASLEEEVGRLSRGKKRKAIPNPNKRFMTLAEALVASDAISEPNESIERADAVEDVIEVGGMEEDEMSNSEEEELTVVRTRAGREVRIPRKY
ncbi:hypothetical protein HZ326_26017 [Fusarium oxysporum f. sp. albedinis]|nr:hypothetical protein HZ326_26017 [Fusarium oxysporum f. sp. albedinis]